MGRSWSSFRNGTRAGSGAKRFNASRRSRKSAPALRYTKTQKNALGSADPFRRGGQGWRHGRGLAHLPNLKNIQKSLQVCIVYDTIVIGRGRVSVGVGRNILSKGKRRSASGRLHRRLTSEAPNQSALGGSPSCRAWLSVAGTVYKKSIQGEKYKGLFELRVQQGNDISRIFYCLPVGNTFVVLHGFMKKTGKTPSRELETALRYKNDYLRRYSSK